ncbi:gastrula zinc finger protein XlCGF26.1-like isoform X2 [Pectinophora gossypiella]|nr:gastrula zinc finger protein XlCGF26.1-like isoform X2 [Pectinophora gossypiella]
MMQLGQNIFGSLSSLTTITLNDTHLHAIYVDNQINIQTDINKVEKNNIPIENQNINEDSCSEEKFDEETNIDYTSELQEETGTNIEELKPKIEEIEMKNVTKTVSQNRWAIKRALQNKKRKFEIISNIDVEELFRRVQINLEELHNFLKKKRKRFQLKKYKCESCVIGFKNENALMRHNKNCHTKDTGDYTCDVCSRRYADKRHLVSHVKKHCYKYLCTVCQYYCHSEKLRNKHAERHRKVFQCFKCGLRYCNRREFYKHFKEWHERFICDHCGISFMMRYSIKDHIRKQHSPYECKQCNRQFARYNGLWRHNKTAHAQLEAAYCVECDKYYDNVYRYRWHLANSTRHTPRRVHRYPCSGCDKVFTKNIYMRDHYNLVHLKQYKHRCESCDKNFIRNADLMKHNKRIHEGILPPRDKICYVCGRGFTTNKILANHVRTHTGERPFACAQCPAKFAQSVALAGHTRALHSKQKADPTE